MIDFHANLPVYRIFFLQDEKVGVINMHTRSMLNIYATQFTEKKVPYVAYQRDDIGYWNLFTASERGNTVLVALHEGKLVL